jgi:hypothetical protein
VPKFQPFRHGEGQMRHDARLAFVW